MLFLTSTPAPLQPFVALDVIFNIHAGTAATFLCIGCYFLHPHGHLYNLPVRWMLFLTSTPAPLQPSSALDVIFNIQQTGLPSEVVADNVLMAALIVPLTSTVQLQFAGPADKPSASQPFPRQFSGPPTNVPPTSLFRASSPVPPATPANNLTRNPASGFP
jgi:hypothetical protein